MVPTGGHSRGSSSSALLTAHVCVGLVELLDARGNGTVGAIFEGEVGVGMSGCRGRCEREGGVGWAYKHTGRRCG